MKPERLFVWVLWKDYTRGEYIAEVPYEGADIGVVVWNSGGGGSQRRWLGRILSTVPTYLWRVVPLVAL